MCQKPTVVRSKNDNIKEWDKANKARAIPNPSTQEEIQGIPTRRDFTDARDSAATVAPIPGADISSPKPDGPTCQMLVANMGRKRLYGAPNRARTYDRATI